MSNVVPISVVIPTYNHARFVIEAVESALRQTRPPAEIIVVDDGSTDDTAEQMAQFVGRVRYVRQANQGVSAARNHGLAIATSGYVAFLDSDDVWHPAKLERQMACFEREPGLGLLGAGTFDWPADRMPTGLPEMPARPVPVTWDKLVVRNSLITSSVVARTDLVRAVGPFDTAIQGPEDRDLWLRVVGRARAGNLPEPLVGYRAVEGSVSRHAARCQAGMLRILDKVDRAGGWAGRRWLRRKAYSYAYHSCAYIHGAAGDYRTAVWNSVRSFCWYPLPYSPALTKTPLERPRRLATQVLRWTGLKSPELGTTATRPSLPPGLGARP